MPEELRSRPAATSGTTWWSGAASLARALSQEGRGLQDLARSQERLAWRMDRLSAGFVAYPERAAAGGRTPPSYVPRPSRPETETQRWLAEQARLLLQQLEAQVRSERHLQTMAQGYGRYQARSGAMPTDRAATLQQQVAAMSREANLQTQVAQTAANLGLEETAYRALRAVAELRQGIGLLASEVERAPWEEALERLRAWDDQLTARTELLEALAAPESDVDRLLVARIQALQQEAQLLRSMGDYASADRALARAAGLTRGYAQRGAGDAVDERVRQVIGGDARTGERITPLGLARVQSAGEAGSGLRRYVVEFQAPADGGSAMADAVIEEIMGRLAEVLRSRR